MGFYCIEFSIKIGEDSSLNEESVDFVRSSREPKSRKSTREAYDWKLKSCARLSFSRVSRG